MTFHVQDSKLHSGDFIFVHHKYIENVLLNHGGLPQVPPLQVHLKIFFVVGKFGGLL